MMKKFIYLVLGFIFLSTFYSNCSQTAFQTLADNQISSASNGNGVVPDTGGSIPVAPTGTGALNVTGTESNVMRVTMGCGYVNQPCVNVTICQAGTSTCQTIPNLLLDTGSYGLRIFKSAVSVSLSQLSTTSGNSVGECVSYMDGTSQWGPVKVADVILGQLRASNVPIQIVDDTFPTGTANNSAIPSDCTGLDSATDGYNGIIGMGLFTEDCGSGCATQTNNRIYFSCSTSSCSGMAVPIAYQVSNPVSFLSTNNNGVILQLPPVPDSGASSASGWLILGIGTQANNTPATTPAFFATDNNGNFKTTFNGSTIDGFIDSGSNGLFFPGPSALSVCSSSSNAPGFFCPSSQMSYTAVQVAASGGTQRTIPFNIGNANVLLAPSNPNVVFNNIGGSIDDSFDWGLPFFLGRSVYIGIQNKTSTLGTGPYWAY